MKERHDRFFADHTEQECRSSATTGTALTPARASLAARSYRAPAWLHSAESRTKRCFGKTTSVRVSWRSGRGALSFPYCPLPRWIDYRCPGRFIAYESVLISIRKSHSKIRSCVRAAVSRQAEAVVVSPLGRPAPTRRRRRNWRTENLTVQLAGWLRLGNLASISTAFASQPKFLL